MDVVYTGHVYAPVYSSHVTYQHFLQLLQEKLDKERKDMEDACDRMRLAFELKFV